MKHEPRPLSGDTLKLFQQVMAQRGAHLLLLTSQGNDLNVPVNALEEMRNILAAEFASSGLTLDSEPNARGQQLEALIDEINRWIWRQQNTKG